MGSLSSKPCLQPTHKCCLGAVPGGGGTKRHVQPASRRQDESVRTNVKHNDWDRTEWREPKVGFVGTKDTDFNGPDCR